MRFQRRFQTPITIGMAGALLAGASAGCLADDGATNAKPLALRTIMQEMGKNMQIVTDGISRGDWELVEKTTPPIADHRQPPDAEKARIIGFFGAEMGRFKAYDTETHDHALAMGNAAKAKDGRAVILAFQQLQTSCYSCHTTFRKPFIAHFYGKKDAP